MLPSLAKGQVKHIYCLIGITLSSESSQSAGTETAVQGWGHGRDSSDTVQQGWHCDKDGRDRCTAEPGAVGCAWLAPGVSRASLWHHFPSGSTQSQPVCFTLSTEKNKTCWSETPGLFSNPELLLAPTFARCPELPVHIPCHIPVPALTVCWDGNSGGCCRALLLQSLLSAVGMPKQYFYTNPTDGRRAQEGGKSC